MIFELLNPEMGLKPFEHAYSTLQNKIILLQEKI